MPLHTHQCGEQLLRTRPPPRNSWPGVLHPLQRPPTLKLAYCLMQKAFVVFLDMCCSQYTCSGHCSAAVFVMRLSAKVLLVESSTTSLTRLKAPSPSSSRSVSNSSAPAGAEVAAAADRVQGWHQS